MITAANEVHPGRITGFLDPNGADTSTTMRMLLGNDELLAPMPAVSLLVACAVILIMTARVVIRRWDA